MKKEFEDFKMRPSNKGLSSEVQDILIKNGYSWWGGDRNVDTSFTYLFLEGGQLSGSNNLSDYQGSELKEEIDIEFIDAHVEEGGHSFSEIPQHNPISGSRNKEEYEIQIGDMFNVDLKTNVPRQTIIVSKEQVAIIEAFAHTRKDEHLNTIYKLNDCEFKIMPRINLGK